jgi:hypothetical protein
MDRASADRYVVGWLDLTFYFSFAGPTVAQCEHS